MNKLCSIFGHKQNERAWYVAELCCPGFNKFEDRDIVHKCERCGLEPISDLLSYKLITSLKNRIDKKYE